MSSFDCNGEESQSADPGAFHSAPHRAELRRTGREGLRKKEPLSHGDQRSQQQSIHQPRVPCTLLLPRNTSSSKF